MLQHLLLACNLLPFMELACIRELAIDRYIGAQLLGDILRERLGCVVAFTPRCVRCQ
jgi:hypothetical protein